MKKFNVLLVVMLVAFAANSFAVDWDSGGGVDRLWSTPANWTGDTLPTTLLDAKVKNAAALGPVIDGTVTATCKLLIMGGNTTLTDTLTITGGTLDAVATAGSHQFCDLNDSTVVIEMSNGTVNIVGTAMNFGRKLGGSATLNLTGGTMNLGNATTGKDVTCAGDIGSSAALNISGAGTVLDIGRKLKFHKGTVTTTQTGGTVNVRELQFDTGGIASLGTVYHLDGGTLNVTWDLFWNAAGDGIIDITDGTFTIRAPKLGEVNAAIAANQIVAFGGTGILNVDSLGDPIIVTATAATAATNPVPDDGATEVDTAVVLSWDAGDGALSHEVFFAREGTALVSQGIQDNPDLDFDPVDPVTTLDALTLGQEYIWRIDEFDALAGGGTKTTGSEWSFTTVLPVATAPVPADAALHIDPNVVLGWDAGISAVSHKVYFGTAASPPFVVNQPGVTYDPLGATDLDFGQIYYWQIGEVDAGANEFLSAVWSFTTLDYAAYDPVPADNATQVAVEPVNLSWSPGADVVTHEVYVADSEVALAAASVYKTLTEATDGSATTYDGVHPEATELFWRVDEVDSGAVTTTGAVWSFTTYLRPASTCRWDGSEDPNLSWDNPDNWDIGWVPRVNDKAFIMTAEPNDPVIGAGVDGVCTQLALGGADGNDFLTITGGSLTVGTVNSGLGDAFNSTAVVDISGGILDMSQCTTYLGRRAGSTFTLNLTGGTFNAGNSTTGKNVMVADNATAQATLNISDGEFNVGKEIWLGDPGVATVNQTGGAVDVAVKMVMSRGGEINGTSYNLLGGTCYAANLMFKGNAVMNIGNGTFIVPSGRMGTVNLYISENRIVPSSPLRELVITADAPIAGQTSITAPINVVPADGQEGLIDPVLLAWGDEVGLYDVYYGLVYDDVLNDDTPNITITEPNYLIPDPFGTDVEVFWKIGELGTVRSFFMISVFAANVSPADDAVDVVQPVLLQWLPGIGAVTHEVFYGSDAVAVAAAVTPDAITTDPNCLIDVVIANGTEFFWRIDEVDAGDVVISEGSVWSFTVVCDGAINPEADLDTDCDVDIDDLQTMAADWLDVAPTETRWEFDMSTDPVGAGNLDLVVRGIQDDYVMSGVGTMLLPGGDLNLESQNPTPGLCDAQLNWVVKATSIPPETKNSVKLWFGMGTSSDPGRQANVGASIYKVAGTPETQTVELWTGCPPPTVACYAPVVLAGFDVDEFVDITVDYDYETDTFDYVVTDGTLEQSGTDVAYSSNNDGDGGGFTLNNVGGQTAEIDALNMWLDDSVLQLTGDIAPVISGGDGTVNLIDFAVLASEWME